MQMTYHFHGEIWRLRLCELKYPMQSLLIHSLQVGFDGDKNIGSTLEGVSKYVRGVYDAAYFATHNMLRS